MDRVSHITPPGSSVALDPFTALDEAAVGLGSLKVAAPKLRGDAICAARLTKLSQRSRARTGHRRSISLLKTRNSYRLRQAEPHRHYRPGEPRGVEADPSSELQHRAVLGEHGGGELGGALLEGMADDALEERSSEAVALQV